MRNTTRVLAFLWLTVLALFAGVTVYNMGTASRTKQNGVDVRKALQKMLLNECCCREALIHLYGGWVRLSGQSVCNDVLRLSGGQLFTGGMRKFDPRGYFRNVQNLHEFGLFCIIGHAIVSALNETNLPLFSKFEFSHLCAQTTDYIRNHPPLRLNSAQIYSMPQLLPLASWL